MISNDFAKEKMICFRFFSSKPPGIVARLGRLKSAYDLKECESLVGDVSLLADLGTIERQVAIDILMELGSDLAAKHEIIPVSMWVTMIQIMDWKDTGKIKSVRSKFSVDVIRKNRQLLLKSVDEMLKTSPRNANRLIMALINYSGNDDEDIVDEILHLPWKKSSKVWEAIMAKYELSPNQKLESYHLLPT